MKYTSYTRRIVFLDVLVSLFVIFDATFQQNLHGGPTRDGAFTFGTSISSPVRRNYDVPVSVVTSKPDGTIDNSFVGAAELRAVTTVSNEDVLFQETWEGSSTSSWTSSTKTTLATSTTGGARGTNRCVQIGGSGERSFLTGPRTAISSNSFPRRVSYYLRVPNTNQDVGYLVLLETVSGTIWPALTIGVEFGTMYSWAFTGRSSGHFIEANRWYKIDAVIDWSKRVVEIWVDDIKRITHKTYYDDTLYVRGISIFNWESGQSFIDELQLINNEATYSQISVSPSQIFFENGIWNGFIRFSISPTNNIRLVVRSETTAPVKNYRGLSNTFNTANGCLPGTASGSYFGNCDACPPGTFSGVDAIECEICLPGTYNSNPGASSCALCDEGTYNPNNRSTNVTDCIQCPEGSSRAGSSFCTVCPPGSSQITPEVCAPCDTGSYSLGGSSCIPCPHGTYNDLTNQSSCTKCPVGHYNPLSGSQESSACLPCLEGTYSDEEGLLQCKPCPRGAYASTQGSTACITCQPGTHLLSSVHPCAGCPRGEYSAFPGQLSCSICDPGYFNNQVNQTECQPCDPGTAALFTRSFMCNPCQGGTYAANAQSVCSACPEGFVSTNRSSNCTACPPGYSSRKRDTVCSPCELGKFSNVSGGVCVDCPTGWYTPSTGATECARRCGNGILESSEFCDDGNLINGDGCSDECVIEPGFTCPVPGEPCQQISSSTAPPPNRVEENEDEPESNTVPIVVGTISGILFFCILGVLLVFLYLRRKSKENINLALQTRSSQISDNESRGSIQLLSRNDSIIFHDRDSSTIYNMIPDFKNSYYHKISEVINSNANGCVPFTELTIDYSKPLGKGSFGLVFKGKWKNRDVAIKVIKSENLSNEEISQFAKEADLMKSMKVHPSVVLFMGIVSMPFCIVTEYLENGDLKSYIKSGQSFPFERKAKIILQIAEGMHHLALEGIVHRDLAARNILLNSNYDAKISDFGLSRILDTNDTVYSKSDVGPLKWMAPEALRHKKYSEKSDVWSFGVCCYEILSGLDPYPGMEAVQAASSVIADGLYPAPPEDTPTELSDIIIACFAFDASARPSFKDLTIGLGSFKESYKLR